MIRVEAYTDGSSLGNPGPSGWAVVLKFGEHQKELSGGEPFSTNNQMELTAVLQAVAAVKRPVELVIHTDSKMVVNWLTGRAACRAPAIANLCEQIKELAEKKGVRLVLNWIKGHAGLRLNERAHALAQAAAEAQKKAANAGEEVPA